MSIVHLQKNSPVATIAEIQQEITEEFALFDSWMDKYEHLIELGKELPLIDAEHKTEDRLIKGCQSRVAGAARRPGGQRHGALHRRFRRHHHQRTGCVDGARIE